MTEPAKELSNQRWKRAWESIAFRRKLILGFVLIAIILSAFPLFFQAIEKRNGAFLNDWLLNYLAVYDMSWMIFAIIWASSLLMLIRCIQDPAVLLQFLWSYILLCLLRVLTITIFPLEPPEGLLPLTDPIANAFYGAHFVTRDLFFSGHTSSVLLIAFSVKRKRDKIGGLIATGVIACLLLIQHVHYTVDVLAAVPLTWLVYLGGKKIAGPGN